LIAWSENTVTFIYIYIFCLKSVLFKEWNYKGILIERMLSLFAILIERMLSLFAILMVYMLYWLHAKLYEECLLLHYWIMRAHNLLAKEMAKWSKDIHNR
jgi:hypothetical protein